MAPQVLHGLFELLVGFVPFVDAGDEVLLVQLAAHEEVDAFQVVELRAGAVGAILQVHVERLEFTLLQAAHLQGLLLLLQDHLTVAILPFHLLDPGLDG